MTFSSPFRATGLALASALMLSASPAVLGAATPADTLVIAAKFDDIVSIDPAEAFEFSGTDMLNNVYDSLVEIDPETGKLTPGLAVSWDVDADGLTYRFKMREGETFHSGNPIRAEDAAFSIQRSVKLNKSPAFILTQFGFTPENVEQKVYAEGDTLVFVTDKAFAPTFVYNCLTSSVATVVDKELVMANEVNGDLGYEWLKTHSAGSGAYKLLSYKPMEAYVLESRGAYWRGEPKLKRIFVRYVPEPAAQRLMVEKGDVDIARNLSTVDYEGIASNPDVKILDDLAGYIFYISANQTKEVFKNPKVLEAMRWLVDYDGMAKSFLKGEFIPHQAFLPRGYLGALEETPYKLDVEKAKELLKEAGVGPFTTTISVRNSQDRVEMATALQNTFAQAGITLELKVGTGSEVLADYRGRNHELTLQSWGPDYPDPHTNAATFAYNPDNRAEAQLGGLLAWRNAYEPGEVQTLAEQAVVELDPAKREALYHEAQRKHRDTSPFIPMFQQLKRSALRANVEGFYSGGTVDNAAYWLTTK